MKVSVISGKELTLAHVERWRQIQATDLDLASPYFCPEFTQAVATVRGDVFVGIIEENGNIVAFFPFQRKSFGLGKPVGGMLSDFHGVIGEPAFSWDKDELLKCCRLTSWKYHYLLTKQTAFSRTQVSESDSHYIDLSNGFQAYIEVLENRGSKIIKDNAYKKRKLAKDIGPVRFVAHDPSPEILTTLFKWKSQQYNKSGLTDVFGFSWTQELLLKILSMQSPTFSGMLSCLHAGDELIAIHMGMRSQWSWNWWFPRHNNFYNSYSPGIMLRLFAAEHAAELGLKRLDLGKGDETTYKPVLSSGVIPVSIGSSSVPCFITSCFSCLEQIENQARHSPLRSILRFPGRLILTQKSKSRFN